MDKNNVLFITRYYILGYRIINIVAGKNSILGKTFGFVVSKIRSIHALKLVSYIIMDTYYKHPVPQMFHLYSNYNNIYFTSS